MSETLKSEINMLLESERRTYVWTLTSSSKPITQMLANLKKISPLSAYETIKTVLTERWVEVENSESPNSLPFLASTRERPYSLVKVINTAMSSKQELSYTYYKSYKMASLLKFIFTPFIPNTHFTSISKLYTEMYYDNTFQDTFKESRSEDIAKIYVAVTFFVRSLNDIENISKVEQFLNFIFKPFKRRIEAFTHLSLESYWHLNSNFLT